MSRIKPLALGDIRGPVLYAGFRDDLRRRVIDHKKARRIIVGPLVSMVFENRLTLMFQTEEMLRAEGITEAEKIQEELDVYNALMPTEDSLSATLFIELPTTADKRSELNRLIGLDEHLLLHIGEHALRAAFEPGRMDDDRISAVQYVRFPLTADAKAALLTEGTPLSIEIDHPQYRHTVSCAEATRASLAEDYA